jgi:hypothetical protein
MIVLMKRAIATTVLVACATIVMTSAQAAGALAVGLKDNDAATYGINYGWTTNQVSEGEAKYQALLGCLAGTAVVDEVRLLCRVVAVFNNQCLAFAWDPANAKPGWGWALDADLESAKTAALDKCRATAGPGRESYCVVDTSGCDTGARVASAPSGPGQTSLQVRSGSTPSSTGGSKR